MINNSVMILSDCATTAVNYFTKNHFSAVCLYVSYNMFHVSMTIAKNEVGKTTNVRLTKYCRVSVLDSSKHFGNHCQFFTKMPYHPVPLQVSKTVRVVTLFFSYQKT